MIDGGVRDSSDIVALGFPVFCRGRAIKGTTKVGTGRAGVPVAVGGQVVAAGDLIVGDRDGVVVIPSDRANEVLKAALVRDRKEKEMLKDVDRGVATVDILGLRKRLEEAGLLEP